MRKKSDYILRVCLILGDAVALVLSFAMAYFIRVHVDPRPYEFNSTLLLFTLETLWVVPFLIIILAALGLYKKSVFLGKSRMPEIGRLILAAILSVAALIVYDFFTDNNLFPVRIVALMSVLLSFLFLVLERMIVRAIVKLIYRKDYGTKRVVIIGNNKNTEYLANYISSSPESGYRLVGVVSARKYIPEDFVHIRM